MKTIKNYSTYFLVAVLVSLGVLTFFVFKPFLTAIIVAAILAVIFQKPYKYFLKVTRKKQGFSALITSLLVVLVVVIPVAAVLGLLINEVASFYQRTFVEGDFVGRYAIPVIRNIENLPFFSQGIDLESLVAQKEVSDSVRNIGQGLFSVVQSIYSKTASSILWIFAMFFALYYFLIDGKKTVEKVIKLSPLRDCYEEILIKKFVSIVRATLKGVLVVGIIQGTLGGIAFAIAGVPSAAAWGVVMTVLSFIPMVGAGLVWLPAAIILLFSGNILGGVFILIAGFLLISTIDNILRPKLIGKDAEMHPLLIFFSTLGGIIMFGLIGFIVGPIIVALFLTLLGIYAGEFEKELEKCNS